jgi:cytochrome c-type biogenesis protein CcmE
MWTIVGVVIAILALIISVLALVASAVFYFKSARQLQDSTRRLQRTMNVLGQYLKATIKNADVDLNINKEGDLVGLNITLHPDPINEQVQISDSPTLIVCEKKSD